MALSQDTIRKFIAQALVLEIIADRGKFGEAGPDFNTEVDKRLAAHLKLPYVELATKFRKQLIELHNMNTPGVAKTFLASRAAKEDPANFGPVLYLIEQERHLSNRF